MDGSSWFNEYYYPEGDADTHALFKLVDEGYDVFVGCNRGTPYSNVNTKFPDADNASSANYAAQNKAKYDFGWYEMGQFDVPAMLTKVTEVSGVEKVTYIGYSQGTAQLFYALAVNEATINAKIDRAIMLAPCLYGTDESTGKAKDITMEDYEMDVKVFQAENVNLFGGPNKDLNQRKVCQP